MQEAFPRAFDMHESENARFVFLLKNAFLELWPTMASSAPLRTLADGGFEGLLDMLLLVIISCNSRTSAVNQGSSRNLELRIIGLQFGQFERMIER
jgi:hypothetical protein